MNLKCWLSLAALISLALPSVALEERVFQSAEGNKTFEATLTGYDEKTEKVTVILKSGSEKRFSMDLLSEDDQKYVKDNAVVLTIARSVQVSFKEIKGKAVKSKAGLVRTSSSELNYEICVYNRSDKVIEELEVRYSLYYCVGSSSATGAKHTPKVEKGVLVFPKLFGKYTETRPSSKVTLIRESRKGKAPPVPSGGGGGGGGGG